MEHAEFDYRSDQSDIQKIFELQTRYKWHAKKTSSLQRMHQLERFRDNVQKYADRIVEAIYTDTKKPIAEIRRIEVDNLIKNIQFNIDNLEKWMAPVHVESSLSTSDYGQILYESRGVCLILGPWNFPLGLSFGPLAAAIAAGNCCILKLSDLCPAISRLAKEIVDATFSPKEVAVFEGSVEVATALLELPFDHIFFTGSPRVGKIVMAAAAKNLSSITLELGGKSPVIIADDANPEQVGADLAAAKKMNGGQACICPDYVFIKPHMKQPVINAFAAACQALFGDKTDGHINEKIAQIVDSRNFERLQSLLLDAKIKGATLECGGQINPEKLTILPTVLSNVTDEMDIMNEEVFGPIIPIVEYNDIDDVITYITERPKPLALYIYSDESDKINHIISGTSSGGVTVNGFFLHYTDPRLPFGGVNNSGMGSYHGFFGFKAFSHERAIYRHNIQ